MKINGKNPLFSSKPIGFMIVPLADSLSTRSPHDGITFATESNKTQTRIASEIKASGEESSRIGRDSLKVTRWVFYATIAVFILTVAWLVLSELDRRTAAATPNSSDSGQSSHHRLTDLARRWQRNGMRRAPILRRPDPDRAERGRRTSRSARSSMAS
jgi:hypothetical protein